MTSVYQLFADSAGRFAEHPALHVPAQCAPYADGAVDYTYAQLLREIAAYRERYATAGYGGGHRVALLLENRAEFFMHWFALNGLGVSVVPVNGEMTAAEMAYLIGHSDSCLVVSVPDKQTAVAEALDVAGSGAAVVFSDDFNSLPAAATAALDTPIDRSTECALLYTSGSTGTPKGCILSNEYFLSCAEWYCSVGGLCTLQPGVERLATPLPLVHMNAMACSSLAMFMTGGCLIQLDRFHPSTWWQTVCDADASIVHYLGVMPAMLLHRPHEPAESAHRIRFGFGAGVNPTHHAPFEARFGFPLIEAWAMTESGCAGAIIASHEPRHVGTSCFGRPTDSIEIRLVDEQGVDVAAGEPGELLVRAAGDDPQRGFFTGYLKDPEATELAWQYGYLNTGDVVRRGEDGQLHFVDRRKNIIRRSGENIAALEVEAALALHPMVEAVAVAPVPDEIRGDEVMAMVVLADHVQPGEAAAHDLLQHALESLLYYKAPGYIGFVDALPLTASNKPQRAELKVLGREMVDQGRCFDLRGHKRRPVQAESG